MVEYISLTGVYVLGWYIYVRRFVKSFGNKILTFHGVNDKPDLSITRNTTRGFREILKYLKEAGYNGVGIGKQQSEKDIAITFDDGWADFYDNAFPILKEFGYSATVFIITDYVGQTSRWDYRQRMHLNWDQIKELAGEGIEFGSHGAGHVDLRKLDDDALEYETAGSKKIIEDKLGRPVDYFSYPFGRFDARVRAAVENAGYEKAFSLSTGEDEFAISRSSVYLYDTPYSIYLKLSKQSWLERGKDYINNCLAGGTIALKKIFPAGKRA